MDKITISADKNKIPTLQEMINQFDRIRKAVQKGGLLLVDSLKYQGSKNEVKK